MKRPLLKIWQFSVVILSITGCSTYLITHGVLDSAEQRAMRLAETRSEFETIVGEPIGTRKTAEGCQVNLYRYVDGEANVIGQSGRPMSGERTGRAGVTALTVGVFEPLMVPVALHERAEATREIYVLYSRDGRILAICPPSRAHPHQSDDRCNSVPRPEADDAYQDGSSE